MRVVKNGSQPTPASLRGRIAHAVQGQGPSTIVHRRVIPYWRERGWVREESGYRGNYQTRHAAFCGRVTEGPSGHLEFFLHQPSTEIRAHRNWHCFVARADGWYFVHMSRQPKDVSSGIMTIERLINEAYKR